MMSAAPARKIRTLFEKGEDNSPSLASTENPTARGPTTDTFVEMPPDKNLGPRGTPNVTLQ